MNPPVVDASFWQRVTEDPILFYSACASLLLGIVSLAAGITRGDALVLARPRLALRVLGAVAAGFAVLLVADQATPASLPWLAGVLDALARVPVYVVALAFGPSVGLVAGGLFAAASAPGAFPGPAEMLFAFELVVLGWLAIYPSPRTARWAGPFNVLVARGLTWGTAGILWLTYESGGVSFASLLDSSSPWPWGVLVAAAVVALVPPRWYEVAFPHSRVAPDHGTRPTLEAACVRSPLEPVTSGEWTAPAHERGELPPPVLLPDDPNA